MKMNPFDLVYDQYKVLKDRLQVTCDAQEKNVLFKRLANLLAVMEFLTTINKTQ